jgi:DNA repair protein RecO (recombination protein O)
MTQSHTYSTEAIVLRVRNLGEKDRVMTLFAPDGKFSAVAKGARAPKSKLAAASQPFVCAKFLLARGRSLDIATQAQIENAHGEISHNLHKTAWASYACELCDALPEHQADEPLYHTLKIFLHHLDEAPPEQTETVGMWFEARYLAVHGYAPTLGKCIACEAKISLPPDDETSRVAFSPQMGGTLCASCAPRDAERLSPPVGALRVLHSLERSPQPPHAGRFSLSKNARYELRRALRTQLQAHLDVRLKSQKFLDEVEATLTV